MYMSDCDYVNVCVCVYDYVCDNVCENVYI